MLPKILVTCFSLICFIKLLFILENETAWSRVAKKELSVVSGCVWHAVQRASEFTAPGYIAELGACANYSSPLYTLYLSS